MAMRAPFEERSTRLSRRPPGVIALLAAAAVLLVAATAQGAPPTRQQRAARYRDRLERRYSGPSLRAPAAKQKKSWLNGRLSHTYEQSPVSGLVHVSTIEYVGYKGKKDASWPRVGDVYLGTIWVGRSGDDGAGDEVVTEIKLPRKTSFAIKNSVRKRQVRCYKGKASGSFSRLKGRKCPNRPVRGVYGWRFVPRSGSWDVPTRRWVQIVFPLRSRKRLKGLVGKRNACLIGAVHNLSGYALDDWDAPRPGDNCPTKDGHGPYQGVFVAPKRR
jgi:hypothetical protein